MNKIEYVRALRELADFIEEKELPDVWQGWYSKESYSHPTCLFYVANKKQFGDMASKIGSFTKSGDSVSTDIQRILPSGATITVWGKKEAVCERVVVGSKIIPAEPEQIIPAKPEREEEIVEWKCPESFISLKEDEPQEVA